MADELKMDVREKLVELLNGIIDGGFKWHSYNYESGDQLNNGEIASHLIDNGVTVQEWVSVTERLPEETGRYLTANKRLDDKIDVFDLWFDGGFWYVDEEDDVFDFEVTHWMPMPNPPKGE